MVLVCFQPSKIQIYANTSVVTLSMMLNCAIVYKTQWCIENEENTQPEDMYDVAIHNENVLELDEEEVKDDAHIAIDVEDIFCCKSTKIKSK